MKMLLYKHSDNNLSQNYKLFVIEYYLIEYKSQKSLLRQFDKYNKTDKILKLTLMILKKNIGVLCKLQTPPEIGSLRMISGEK